MKRLIYFYTEMSGKRIVFSTNTPNDQGFRIPNDVLDFGRYSKNPVLLSQHNWESLPLGHMTDIDFNDGEWTGVPVFHKITEESRQASELWEAGYLKACSIGGFKELKTTGKMTRDKDGNQTPEIWTDKDGLAVATTFEIYEISMVTIPSNMDAVQKQSYLTANAELLNAKCYDEISLKTLEKELTTLNSKLKTMEDQELEAAKKLVKDAEDKVKKENADKLAADKTKADKLSADKLKAEQDEAAKLAAEKKTAAELPDVIKAAKEEDDKKKKAGSGSQIVDMFKSAVVALSGDNSIYGDTTPTLNPPPAKNLYDVKNSGEADKALFNKLEESVGKMKAKQEAKEKLQTAMMNASALTASALAAKEKAEKADASDEDKEEFLKAKKEAEDAVEMCSQLESDMDDMDDSAEMKAAKKKVKEKEELASKLAAGKVKLKTMDELKADVAADKMKLAAKPNPSNRIAFTGGYPKTMSQLKADDSGKKLIAKVQSHTEGTEAVELGAYLSALRNEPKYKAIFDKTRVVMNATEQNYKSFRRNSQSEPGESVDALISRLQGGNINYTNFQNGSTKTLSTLTATDNFLASPDLFAMDFLDLAIFKLFPTTSWKNDIPIFGAQTTENNTGLIWANIAANPTIYMGTQPVSPANYTYTDTAVALNLTPFWMQPILWTPLTMAQLRYDQMSTGWAQSFAVMGTYIDDFLLYTLGASVPHKSITYSTGISPNPTGGNTTAQQFVLNGNVDNPYSFYYNSLFQGSLNNPTLNDVLVPELVYNKQNFDLDNEKPILVIDPTTNTLIKQTGQSQSLLTRWVDDSGKDQLAFSHTRFTQRSRVLAFNPQTAQVLSPFGIIPSVATSANLGFIPSQVGIGIGNLDVFMIQDPTAYGYKMSADVRMGITPLRTNGDGTSILAYGPEIIS
jgi:hypothetical protein